MFNLLDHWYCCECDHRQALKDSVPMPSVVNREKSVQIGTYLAMREREIFIFFSCVLHIQKVTKFRATTVDNKDLKRSFFCKSCKLF